MHTPARIIVIMGVSGCGKSTVGEQLAHSLGVPFLDGDRFHPENNLDKMRAGVPLSDADRWPWLADLGCALAVAAEREGGVVGACSALKRSYRDFLTAEAAEPVLFIHLEGAPDAIAARLRARRHDYMPAALLDSQFATLEPPATDENAIAISIDPPVEDIVAAALHVIRQAMP